MTIEEARIARFAALLGRTMADRPMQEVMDRINKFTLVYRPESRCLFLDDSCFDGVCRCQQ